jgi:DNA mismatch repair protein MSH3
MIAARLEAVSEIAESLGSSGGLQLEGTVPGSGKGGGSAGAASRGWIVQGGFQGLLAPVLTFLGKMVDVERGITRIFHRTATTAEVLWFQVLLIWHLGICNFILLLKFVVTRVMQATLELSE